MDMREYVSKSNLKRLISMALNVFNVTDLSEKEEVILEEKFSLILDGILAIVKIDALHMDTFNQALIYVVIYQLYCIIKLEEIIDENNV